MKIDPAKGLAAHARQAVINSQSVDEFRDRAVQVVDQAIDVFLDPQRTTSQGKKAWEDLGQLQLALAAYQERYDSDMRANDAKAYEAVNAKTTGYPVGQTVAVGAVPSLLPEGKPLTKGIRSFGQPSVDLKSTPFRVRREGDFVGNLARNLEDHLGLYASIAMAPGSITTALGPVSGAEMLKAASQLLPVLHETREELANLGYRAPTTVHCSMTQRICETDEITFPGGWFYPESKEHRVVNFGTIPYYEADLPGLPDRLGSAMRTGNQGLSSTGAGAELVEWVSSQSHVDQAVVDQLRSSAVGVMDDALRVLCEPGSDPKEGKIHHQRLNNLGRALQVAHEKWGADWGTHWEVLLKDFSQAVPVYATAARIPAADGAAVEDVAAHKLLELRKRVSLLRLNEYGDIAVPYASQTR